MTGFNNVIQGVLHFFQKPEVKAAFAPAETALMGEIFTLLQNHAAKTDTSVDNVLVGLAKTALTAQAVDPAKLNQ